MPKGNKVIPCKWIFKIKRDINREVSQYKARLVAKDYYQNFGIDYDEIFSPVVRNSTIRFLLATAIELNLNIDHLDVEIAFWNGELKEKVYMQQPENFIFMGQENTVCLLNRAIYD